LQCTNRRCVQRRYSAGFGHTHVRRLSIARNVERNHDCSVRHCMRIDLVLQPVLRQNLCDLANVISVAVAKIPTHQTRRRAHADGIVAGRSREILTHLTALPNMHLVRRLLDRLRALLNVLLLLLFGLDLGRLRNFDRLRLRRSNLLGLWLLVSYSRRFVGDDVICLIVARQRYRTGTRQGNGNRIAQLVLIPSPFMARESDPCSVSEDQPNDRSMKEQRSADWALPRFVDVEDVNALHSWSDTVVSRSKCW